MTYSSDLHGNAPDESEIALVLIDVINDLEFEGGEELFRTALPAARNIARLKERAHQAGVPGSLLDEVPRQGPGNLVAFTFYER